MIKKHHVVHGRANEEVQPSRPHGGLWYNGEIRQNYHWSSRKSMINEQRGTGFLLDHTTTDKSINIFKALDITIFSPIQMFIVAYILKSYGSFSLSVILGSKRFLLRNAFSCFFFYPQLHKFQTLN